MKKIWVFAMAAVLAASGASAQTAPPAAGAAKVDSAVSKVSAAFEAAYNVEDVAKVMALYTDDAIEMPPNQPMVQGKRAIEAFQRKNFADADGKASLKPMASAITGDTAWEVGTYTNALKFKANNQTFNDQGKYIVLLKRGADNQWRVAYLCYNSDLPPMPPPPPPKPAR